MQTVTRKISDILADYRASLDRVDDAKAALRAAEDARDNAEHELRSAMEAAGLTDDGAKVSGAGVTVTWRQKMRAKYDPAKWDTLVRWAVDTNNQHIVQRRLTDKAVLELIDNGVALPDGLSVEAYDDIDFRRS